MCSFHHTATDSHQIAIEGHHQSRPSELIHYHLGQNSPLFLCEFCRRSRSFLGNIACLLIIGRDIGPKEWNTWAPCLNFWTTKLYDNFRATAIKARGPCSRLSAITWTSECGPSLASLQRQPIRTLGDIRARWAKWATENSVIWMEAIGHSRAHNASSPVFALTVKKVCKETLLFILLFQK